jgi:ABC-type branched-subunit amino acid transport system substrate-binding protein
MQYSRSRLAVTAVIVMTLAGGCGTRLQDSEVAAMRAKTSGAAAGLAGTDPAASSADATVAGDAAATGTDGAAADLSGSPAAVASASGGATSGAQPGHAAGQSTSGSSPATAAGAGGKAAPAASSGAAAKTGASPAAGTAQPGASGGTAAGASGGVFPIPSDPVSVKGAHSQGVTDKDITIGVVAPLSGAAGFLGENEVDAIRGVFGMVNAGGGIRGRQIRTIVADSQFEPTLVATAAKKLVEQDKVFALMDVLGDAEAPYVTSKGIPLFVLGMIPSVFSSKYPTTHVFGGNTLDFVAALAYNVTQQVKLPIKTTAILYDTTNVPIAPWVKYMVKAWEKWGVQVKSTDAFNLSDGDCTRIVLKVQQQAVDFWDLGQSLAWPACAAAMARQNYKPPQGFGGPYSADASFVAQSGTGAADSIAQTPGVQIGKQAGEPYPYLPSGKAPEVERYVASMKKFSPKSSDVNSLENVWTQNFWSGARLVVDSIAAQADAVTWNGVNTWVGRQKNWASGIQAPIKSLDPKCKATGDIWNFQWKVVNGQYQHSDWQPYGGRIVIPKEMKDFMMPGAGDCYLTAMADAELR